MEKGHIYGYARVSTKGQAREGNSLEAQEEQLLAKGAERVFKDAFTGTKMHRVAFDELLSILKEGDTLMVTKLDRLARSTIEGAALVRQLNDKGIAIHVLNLGVLDNNSPQGKVMTSVFFAIAEFERDMIVARTQEGKEFARRNPNFRDGRKPTDTVRLNHALEELERGKTYKQVARETGISVSTIQRARRRKREEELLKLS